MFKFTGKYLKNPWSHGGNNQQQQQQQTENHHEHDDDFIIVDHHNSNSHNDNDNNNDNGNGNNSDITPKFDQSLPSSPSSSPSSSSPSSQSKQQPHKEQASKNVAATPQSFYSLVSEQEVALTNSMVEVNLPFTTTTPHHNHNTQNNNSNNSNSSSPYGNYRIVIELLAIIHVRRSVENLANLSIHLHHHHHHHHSHNSKNNNHSNKNSNNNNSVLIPIHESVQLKYSEHFCAPTPAPSSSSSSSSSSSESSSSSALSFTSFFKSTSANTANTSHDMMMTTMMDENNSNGDENVGGENSNNSSSNVIVGKNGVFWMSDPIHVPSIRYSSSNDDTDSKGEKRDKNDKNINEENDAMANRDYITVSMIPVKQQSYVFQPKIKFLVRLMSQYEILSTQTLTLGSGGDSSSNVVNHQTTTDSEKNGNGNGSNGNGGSNGGDALLNSMIEKMAQLQCNSVGVYCIALTDRFEYGPLSDRSSSFFGRMTDKLSLMPSSMTPPQFDFIVQSEAFSCTEQVNKQFCTRLFPVYKVHLGPTQKLIIGCDVRSLASSLSLIKMNWLAEDVTFNVLLLRVASSAQLIERCEELSSVAHTAVACMEQYKDGAMLEEQLKILKASRDQSEEGVSVGSSNASTMIHAEKHGSFYSNYLQADLAQVVHRGESILVQKRKLLQQIRDVEAHCNQVGYEDDGAAPNQLESMIEAVNLGAEAFDFAFEDLNQAKQALKLLPQRIPLCRQLKKRLLYMESKMRANMTIDVIDRENRVLTDLQASLSRAFNDDFSQCAIVQQRMNDLNRTIGVLEQKKEQILRMILEKKEREERERLAAQEEEKRREQEERERRRQRDLMLEQQRKELEARRAREEAEAELRRKQKQEQEELERQRKLEELQKSTIAPSPVDSGSSGSGTSNNSESPNVSPSKSPSAVQSSVNDSTDHISVSGDTVTDTDDLSQQNKSTASEAIGGRTEENDDDLATSVVNREPEQQQQSKKRKKKKKRIIDNIEEKVVTNHSIPVRIRKNSTNSRPSIALTATATIKTGVDDNLPPPPTTTGTGAAMGGPNHSPIRPEFAGLDHGQVIYELHQCLKQLLRIGAINQQVVPSDGDMDRLLIPKDDASAVKKIEDFVYLIVQYVFLGNRLVAKSKWFGKQSATSNQPTPVLTIIRGVNDRCNRIVSDFEATLEQVISQEELLCEQFVRWSITQHLLQPVIAALMQNAKYTAKFYSKNSLFCCQSFHDEFMCVMDLLGQMQLQCD